MTDYYLVTRYIKMNEVGRIFFTGLLIFKELWILVGMVTSNQVFEMPDKCQRCDNLFDITYDLESEEGNDIMEALKSMPSLCWPPTSIKG